MNLYSLSSEKLGLPRGEPKSSLNKVPTIKPSASKIYGDMSRVHASQSRATNSTIPNDQPQVSLATTRKNLPQY